MIFDDLHKILKAGLPPVLAIFGEELEIVSELKTQFLSAVGYDPTNLSQSYYDLSETFCDPNVALEELESLPFFEESHLVIFENLTNLTGQKKQSFDEKQVARFEAYLDAPLETTQLVIFINGKLDNRLKLTKKLKKTAVCLEASKLRPGQLIQFFTQSGLSRPVLTRVIEKSADSYAVTKQNIEMLKTYAGARDITLADVEKVVPRSLQDTIFLLSDLILRGEISKARELMNDLLLQGEDSIKLTNILASTFRLYLQVKVMANKGKREPDMIKVLKISPYRVKLAHQAVQNLSINYLKNSLKKLIDLDYDSKTSKADKNYLLDLTLIKLSKA